MFTGLSFAAQNTLAATVQWADKTVTYKATDQNELKDVLKEILGRAGITAQISDNIKGRFSRAGTFKSRQLFEDIVRDNSLLPYYDGSILYVYSAQDVSSKSFVLNPQTVGRVMATLAQMGMLDGRNTVRGNDRDGFIIANGAPRFVQEVEEVVRASQAQSYASPPVLRFFPLKYAWAHDVTISHNSKDIVVPGIASTLRRLVNPGSVRPAIYLDDGERSTGGPEQKLRGTGMRREGDRSDASGAPVTPPQTIAKATVADLTRPVTQTDGPGIESDRRSNGLIIRDSVEKMPYYEELIKQLDVEPVQIEIQAMIVDVDLDKIDQLGVGWSWQNKFFNVNNVGGGTNIATGSVGSGGFRAGAGNAGAPNNGGLALSAVLGNNRNFLLDVKALSEDGLLRVVSRPQVVTLANVEAVLEELRTVYIQVAGAYEVDLYKVSAGTTLKVVPHPISEGGTTKIRLFVSIEDGKIDNAGGGTSGPPDVSKAALNTQAILFEGESLLLGGLVREKTNKGVTKIPLLGDIPYLGNLFKYSSNTSERKERLFLISPRIVPANRVAQKDTQFLEKPPVTTLVPAPKAEEKSQ